MAGGEFNPADWDLRASAPAKINLGLEIVARRADGYHDLRTVFQTVDLADDLYVRAAADGHLRLTVSGPEAVAGGEDNLVLRAARALAARSGSKRGAELHLHKRIPAGGGLGGGSSDAAAALVALERLWGLDPDPELLRTLAVSLGADVPFFLMGGTARGEGRGEVLHRLPLMPAWGILLVLPEVRVSTADAFALANIGLTESRNRLKLLKLALSQNDLPGVVCHFVNDLEAAATRLEPGLDDIRREVESTLGPVCMTGSGSGFFALTPTRGEAEKLANSGRSPSADLPPDGLGNSRAIGQSGDVSRSGVSERYRLIASGPVATPARIVGDGAGD